MIRLALQSLVFAFGPEGAPVAPDAGWRDVGLYLLISGEFAFVTGAIYVLAMVATRPRIPFLFGNRVLAILFVLDLFFAMGWSPNAGLLAAAVTGTLLVLVLHTTVISIAPRSISRDVLALVRDVVAEDPPRSVTAGMVESWFVSGFVFERGAVHLRIEEQVALGHLILRADKDKVRLVLTPRGRRALRLLEAAAWIAGERP